MVEDAASSQGARHLNLAVAVQHHPARAHLIPELLARLGEADVVADPNPDGPRAPIRTYLECLRRAPAAASHLLIVQDDTQPCDDFRARAEAAIDERPTDLLAFFLAGAPIRSARLAMQARRRGERWALMHSGDWTPTVALVWPALLIPRFLTFVEKHPGIAKTGDDNVTGAFVRIEKLPVWVTVPSLVEHPDREPSLIGRKASQGRNRMRVAAVPAETSLALSEPLR